MGNQHRYMPLAASVAGKRGFSGWCMRVLFVAGVTVCIATIFAAVRMAMRGTSHPPSYKISQSQPPCSPPPIKPIIIRSYCKDGTPVVPAVAATLAELASMPRHLAAELTERELAADPWSSRTQPFMNVFLVWLSHRDTWMAVQDRVLASVLNIRNARIRIISNSLPHGMFAHLIQQGHDISVMRYNLTAWMVDIPGGAWLSQLQAATESPHAETQLSDFIRLVVLYKFGGLYLDTDALWINDVTDMPVNFVGKIDYLKLEPSCDFCLDKRWYLANGVLSFRARHPFIRHLLMKIDDHPFDPMSRTDIGPRFLTVEYQEAPNNLVRDITLLDEPVLYPIPGPDVPKHMVAAKDATGVARRILASSHSVHVFSYTFNQLPIAADSTYGILLSELRGPLHESLCVCEVHTQLGSATLCTPHSVVIPYRQLPHSWYWPFARVCVNVRGENLLSAGLRAAPIKLTIRATHGVLRNWRAAPARQIDLNIDTVSAVNDALASLEYRHAGGYCNDMIEVSATWRADSTSVRFPVSAPCIDATKLLAVPVGLRQENPASWSGLLGPEVASVTEAQLAADSTRAQEFSRCMRYGSHTLVSTKPPACTNVALLVSATGFYVAWLDELIASAEQYFLPGYLVHYFILTDRYDLPLEPRDRVHVIFQRQLGWPMDSMYRHQLYLKHRAAFKDMDFIMVLDADAAFSAPVGPEVLGSTMGTLQSFFFGQPANVAPFETDTKSTSFIGSSGTCYYAGGLFGGTLPGFTALLQRSTWLMEWDLVMLHRTAPHDDESYLNKMFHVYPPEVSLGGNYIMPEPPADRAWGLKGVNWKEAFPPKIYNLGARKWLAGTVEADRDYRAAADPLGVLTSIEGMVDLPTLDIAVCAPLSGTRSARAAWVKRLIASVDRWYSHTARVVIMDTSTDALQGDPPSLIDRSRVQYLRAPISSAGANSCSPAALANLLQEVRAPHVMVLGHQAVLTWQSSVPFLSLAVHELQQDDTLTSQRTAPVLGLCPRVTGSGKRGRGDSSARFDAPEGCALVTFEDGTVQPSYGCGSCDVWQEGFVNGPPALRFDTPMRELTCFTLDGAAALQDFDSIVAETEFLLDSARALARIPAQPFAATCASGLSCTAAAAVALISANATGGGPLRPPFGPAFPNASALSRAMRPFRCLADMQPLLQEPRHTA